MHAHLLARGCHRPRQQGRRAGLVGWLDLASYSLLERAVFKPPHMP